VLTRACERGYLNRMYRPADSPRGAGSQGIEINHLGKDGRRDGPFMRRLPLVGTLGSHFAVCSAVGHFISNLIASWAQPDTGFPPEVTAGR